MTALYVIGAIVLIVAVRILISVVVRGTVRAAARPIEKVLQNRSIQDETERVAQRLQAQQQMNAQYGNPPYGAAQYPNPQPLNGQYGAPQPQYGAPQYWNNQPGGSGSSPTGWPQ